MDEQAALLESKVREMQEAQDALAAMMLDYTRSPPTAESRGKLLGAAISFTFQAAAIQLIVYGIISDAGGFDLKG